ncbi:MAG: HU family DNA-binding protein [Bacteroidaceae bacterium]|nr:HU family DNA-binding protein [Bacteroidaceae bacterium]
MGKVFIKAKQQYFKPEDKQMWFTKSITYTKIGFDQLVEHIAKDSGMSEGACDGAVRSIVKQVEEMVLNGHTIFIKDLGSFKMSISAKAPLDEEEAGAKQVYRRRLLFHPSEKLKDEVESTELVSVIKD